MKCPSCGARMKEGHLYCEKCGREIQMVPDFEPEIENSIRETLSSVGEEIEGEKGSARDAEAQSTKGSSERSQERKRLLVTWIAVFSAVTVLTLLGGLFFYHRYSYDYQVRQARKYAQNGSYEKAIDYLERAQELDRNGVDAVFLEADYYLELKEEDQALFLLLNMIERKQLTYDQLEKAYERIVSIYDSQGKYEEISRLLKECTEEGIQNHFQNYMALEPQLDYPSGDYDRVLMLKLSANTTGKIYYTFDGSDPNEHSLIYTAPLFLESGEYQISAVFVNDYGIKSPVVRGWYVIHVAVPKAPEVPVQSGDYHEITMIEVNSDEEGEIHYTSDGSEPTRDSPLYTSPIQMPLGRSNFKFVVISDEGVSSEVVSRSFDFTLDTQITVEKAARNVIQALYDRKVLSDLYGHSPEIEGKYVFAYDTIVEIPDLGYYYILDEFVEDGSGTRTKTGRLYAVEVYTGAPNRLIYHENGEMGLISLTDTKS